MRELTEAQSLTGWAEAGETLVGWWLATSLGDGARIAGRIEQFGARGDEIEVHLLGGSCDSLAYLVLPLGALRAAEVLTIVGTGRRAWHQGREVLFFPPDLTYQPPANAT